MLDIAVLFNCKSCQTKIEINSKSLLETDLRYF